jgi:hypothetical protein
MTAPVTLGALPQVKSKGLLRADSIRHQWFGLGTGNRGRTCGRRARLWRACPSGTCRGRSR